ncbi:MAG: GNAT family N-acetyltransferase [Planctomycetota bacterium]|nr:GNAT family N-acetyltransferase [Planctomycetota bacterium]
MTRTAPSRADGNHGSPRAVRVDRDLFMPAARRLVAQEGHDVEAAARRLVDSAPRHGIDLTRCFVVLDERPGPRGPLVRQACLAVPGSGRTAMFFLSEPHPRRPETPDDLGERVACLEAVCDHLEHALPERVRLAQALPEPDHAWALDAFRSASFVDVGTLAYLRAEADAPGAPSGTDQPVWPPGVRVDRLSDIGGSGTPSDRRAADEHLMRALEATYVDTLDCPELCGLRDLHDVLDSHRSTGTYDPSLWHLVWLDGRPEGALLLNRCPDQFSVELVYLGLSPALRRRGLGRRLLAMGMARVRRTHPAWAVTCAVDERNTPALRVYESLGFEVSARRCALVRRLGSSDIRAT